MNFLSRDGQMLSGRVKHNGLTAPRGMCEGEPVIGAGAVVGDGVQTRGINVVERVRRIEPELKLKKESGLSSSIRGRVKRIIRGQPTQLGISIHKTKDKLAILGGIMESQEFNQHRRGSQGFQLLSSMTSKEVLSSNRLVWVLET